MRADEHVAEAVSWLSIFREAETMEERQGAIQHAREAIQNAEREVQEE